MCGALVIGIAIICASRAAAQSPLKGFWTRESIQCDPDAAPCRSFSTRQDSWAAQLAIDVRGERVIVSGPAGLFVLVHVDTFAVDGRLTHWLAGRRGIARDLTVPAESYGVGRTISRRMWAGESWTVSVDGRRLTHRYQWTTTRGVPTKVVMVYRRSAG